MSSSADASAGAGASVIGAHHATHMHATSPGSSPIGTNAQAKPLGTPT